MAFHIDIKLNVHTTITVSLYQKMSGYCKALLRYGLNMQYA